MDSGRPSLTVVGGKEHVEGTEQANLGKAERADGNGRAIALLRALVSELERGSRTARDVMVVYTVTPPEIHQTPDVDFVMTKGLSVPEASWMLMRLQHRMVLVENSGSAAVADVFED
jgi:hypothetical protein